MDKGQKTKDNILLKAMGFASSYGLENVTIGEIAKLVGMSRTGVISHFKNKEDMQLAILEFSEKVYRENVTEKIQGKDALSRLESFCDLWIDWVSKLQFKRKVSCPFVKAAYEYQDRENCAVRDKIVRQQSRLLAFMASFVDECKKEGFFNESVDSKEFAFNIYGLYLSYTLSKNLLKDRDSSQMLNSSLRSMIKNSLREKSI
ncbi:TetR/AcrR family transcriptional regulator [Halobacteriovorax sp. GB3]|uniref:TetR/AcrR family transcriptional regulator n=1 Tax=Halobacteriovorax sp. GB3 TaxID=2719615 RepID=UPI002360EA39|nr:TetR/AcrR family transcriptional regulator [Halobacteriovorax sp. GB3]MDD0852178.1 TetR/AcrR family transcriptional regulator [Halobacteriovorax sp. GB3]